MKAAQYYGPRDVRIEDIPEPELLPGTVRIDVAWCGICGTDVHEFIDGPIFCPSPGHPHPLIGQELPITLGHEISGTVSEVGDGVTDIAVGDRVVVEGLYVCEQCDQCRSGNYNRCTNLGSVGLSGGAGGLSEQVVVEQRWVYPIGDLPLDEAALIEPLSVAYHAVRRSEAASGQTALIGGAGPIGLLVGAVLRAMGVRVFISEISQTRIEKARSSGVANVVLDPSREDILARVDELTDGLGVDVAFECSGVNIVLDQLFDAIRPGGVIVNVAIWGAPARVDMKKIVGKEIELRGTISYANDHAATIRLVQSGHIDLKPFISHRIALDDLLTQGFETLVNRNETAVKVIVHP